MMETGTFKSSNCTRLSRKRSKTCATAQESLRRKRLRVTRSMLKVATQPVEVEGAGRRSAEAAMMVTQDASAVPPSGSFVSKATSQKQQYTQQLACKENILEYTEGLGTSLHGSVGPLRPKQHMPQALPSHHHLEVTRDCIAETSMDAVMTSSMVSMECRSHAPSLPNHFLLSAGHVPSHTRTRHQPPQQPCKLKFGRPVMSCDMLDVGLENHPLPNLKWAHSADLWWTMRSKDVSKATPEVELRLRHPEILSSMRVILLDWMMEVCEEYKLHRETYYLAIDMFDRFMDIRTNVRKEQLQLLGVTCLFIASKIEEIYPPKATDFAYVTDGACSVTDLLETELIVCKVLNWKLNHSVVTVSTWVNTYMQLGSHHLRPPGVKAKEFDYPAYSSVEFPKVMKLLDLSMLDIASRKFGSSVLAASAVYLQSERSRANLAVITGFEFSDIEGCVHWMHPIAVVLSQKPFVAKNAFPGVPPHDTHNIQTHDVSISMMEDSMELRRSQEASPAQYALLQDCSVMMTPPRNERRCLAPINTA